MAFQILSCIITQGQGNASAARRIGRAVTDLVFTTAIRYPTGYGIAAGTAGDNLNLARHHEGGIETHPELADQLVGQLRPVLAGCRRFHERLRAGTRDGAKGLLHVVSRKADAVVGDGQRSRLLVGADGDLTIEHLGGIAG